MKMRVTIFFRLLLCASFLFLGSCSKDDGSSSSSSFDPIYSTYFVTCKNCHLGSGSTGTVLDFSTADAAYASLVGKTALSPSSSSCAGAQFVVTSAPDTSYLLGTLDVSLQGSGNFQSLPGCTPDTTHTTYLTAQEIAAVKSWISGGAAR